MDDDIELLRRYAHESSEEAFTELVHRHVNLVYSAALRRVGNDSHVAEEVAQSVFTTLARKAPALLHHPVLGGWLHRCTCYTAATAVREHLRRGRQEQQAEHMTQFQDSNDAHEAAWKSVGPIVDSLLDELGAPERDVIVLRFFESRSFHEIGSAMRLSEDAARMRVNRALDRLRELLARRGVVSSSAALGLALANHASFAAPAGLAAATAGAALSNAAANAGFLSSLKLSLAGGGPLILMTKILSFVVLGSLLLVASGRAYHQMTSDRAPNAPIASLGSDNLPQPTPRPASPPSTAPLAKFASDQTASGQPAAAPAPAAKIITEVTNAGRATPEAANETMYWAMEHGEVQVLADDIAYEPDAKAIVQKIFDVLPPEARAFYGTAEIMMAAVACYGNVGHIDRLEFVGSNSTGPDTVTLSYVRNGELLKGGPRVRTIPMVKGDDGWKNVGQGSLYLDKGRAEALVTTAEELAANPSSTRAAKVKMPPAPPKP